METDGRQNDGRPIGERAGEKPEGQPAIQNRPDNKNEAQGPAGLQGKSDGQPDQKSGGPKSPTPEQGDAKNSQGSDKSGQDSNQKNPDAQDRQSSPADSANNQPDKQPADAQHPKRPREQGGDQRDNEQRQAGNQRPEKADPRPPARNKDVKQKHLAEKNPAQQSPARQESQLFKFLAQAGRQFSYLLAGVICGILVWMFRKELSDLWNQLFKRSQPTAKDQSQPSLPPEKPLPDFASFREPFQNGLAGKWTNAQLIQYTFQALEAWARERQQFREEDQTPFEFATQLAEINEAVSLEAKELADLHGRCFFGADSVSRSETSRLASLWQLMTRESSPRPI